MHWLRWLAGMICCSSSLLPGAELPVKPASGYVPGVSDFPRWETVYLLEKIYVSRVEPVLRKKCFSCHTRPSTILWWQKLPLLGRLVRRTIGKSLRAMDLDFGFPFVGTRSMRSDLLRLKRIVESKKMPPPWWVFVTRKPQLTTEEGRIILSWANRGLKVLPK